MASVTVSLHERFEQFDNLLLLAARELIGFGKELLEAALGYGLLCFWFFDAEEFINTHPQSEGEFRQHFTARRLIPSFPEGDIGMMNAELLSEGLLRESGGFTQGGKMLAVLTTRLDRRSSHDKGAYLTS